MTTRYLFSAVSLLGLASCAAHQTRSDAPPERLPVEAIFQEPATVPVSAEDREPIWTALLELYSSGRIATEAEYVDRTSRTTGYGPTARGRKARLVLLTQRDDSLGPYTATWLAAVQDSGWATLCSERDPQVCPDSGLKTFLHLANPGLLGDTAVVRADESGLDPALCRKRRTFAGYFTRYPSFRKNAEGRWSFVGFASAFPGFSASGFCGPTTK